MGIQNKPKRGAGRRDSAANAAARRELAELIVTIDDPAALERLFDEIFTRAELHDLVLRWRLLKMLKEGGTPPQGAFEDLKYLEPVRDYKARHASTMLTFDAVVDAIDKIEAGASGKAA